MCAHTYAYIYTYTQSGITGCRFQRLVWRRSTDIGAIPSIGSLPFKDKAPEATKGIHNCTTLTRAGQSDPPGFVVRVAGRRPCLLPLETQLSRAQNPLTSGTKMVIEVRAGLPMTLTIPALLGPMSYMVTHPPGVRGQLGEPSRKSQGIMTVS